MIRRAASVGLSQSLGRGIKAPNRQPCSPKSIAMDIGDGTYQGAAGDHPPTAPRRVGQGVRTCETGTAPIRCERWPTCPSAWHGRRTDTHDAVQHLHLLGDFGHDGPKIGSWDVSPVLIPLDADAELSCAGHLFEESLHRLTVVSR